MSNLSDTAFPLLGEPMNGHYGLTKHELAAVIIGGHMAAGKEKLPPLEREILGNEAYLLAKTILNKFNPNNETNNPTLSPPF